MQNVDIQKYQMIFFKLFIRTIHFNKSYFKCKRKDLLAWFSNTTHESEDRLDWTNPLKSQKNQTL